MQNAAFLQQTCETVPTLIAAIRYGIRLVRRDIARVASSICCERAVRGPGSSVIVAPHPDDEVFGAGGLIASKRAAGVRVDVVFLTDGGESHAGCCGLSAGEIGANRRRLAERAGGLLGIEDGNRHWLEWADGTLPRTGAPGFAEAATTMKAVLEDLAPQEVYCPHPMEVWSDHVAASEIVAAAAAGMATRPRIYYYLVWAWLNQPLRGLLKLGWRKSRRCDIGDVFEAKKAAMQAYLDGRAPGCGRPWIGVLPADLLRAFDWPHELFFEAATVGTAESLRESRN